MIVGSMIGGIGGAILSAGALMIAGKPLLVVAGGYMVGGSVSMLAVLVLGLRRPPAGPPAQRPGPPRSLFRLVPLHS